MNHHQPYRPQIAQIFADFIRADTRDTRRFMDPFVGLAGNDHIRICEDTDGPIPVQLLTTN